MGGKNERVGQKEGGGEETRRGGEVVNSYKELALVSQ